MKVLLIASFAESLVNFRKDLIIAMISAGNEVVVAAPDITLASKTFKTLNSLGVKIHNFPMSRSGVNIAYDMYTIFSLWKLFRKEKPDLFLGYTIKPVIYGLLSSWIASVPYRYGLITGLGFVFRRENNEKPILSARIAKLLYGIALKFSTKIFFQNTDDERLFRTLKLIPENIPSVVLNGSGVNLSEYAETLSIIQEYDCCEFLMISRLLQDKGVREYAEAAKRIKAEYPKVNFKLVGWIDESPGSIKKSELDEWVNSGHIDFMGRLADVRLEIKNCNVYVLPSYSEGTPRSVLEAMSVGRAIITTDTPGCRETVVNNHNGYLIPPRSSNELYKAMVKFIKDITLSKRMGKNSRILAEQKYDVDIVNKYMLAEMNIFLPK
jgi:glycosyltransferase involved in cell wall biosynthesis